MTSLTCSTKPLPCRHANAYTLILEISDLQEEGIVVKALDSQWKMNDRRGDWVKMKPDYVENHEIDALIIGGYFGTGRQANKISEYLLGILDTKAIHEPQFVSFCRSMIMPALLNQHGYRVGTGLSDKERYQVETRIHPILKKLKRPPKHYRVTGHRKEKPDEWITDPSHSVVLQV